MWSLFGRSPEPITLRAVDVSIRAGAPLEPRALQLRIAQARLAQPLDGGRPFTVFDVRVQYGPREWSVQHRFSEFKILAQVLQERHEGRAPLPMLPPEHAKLLGGAAASEASAQLQAALETYLIRITAIVPLSDDCLSAFLGLETLHAPQLPSPFQSPLSARAEDATRADWGELADAAQAAGVARDALEQAAVESPPVEIVPPETPPAACRAAPPAFEWETLWEGSIGGYDSEDSQASEDDDDVDVLRPMMSLR